MSYGYSDLGDREDYEDDGFFALAPEDDADEDEGEDEDGNLDGGEDRFLDSSWEDRFEMAMGGWD